MKGVRHVLHIELVDPPADFDGMTDLLATLQVGEENRLGEAGRFFSVEFELRPDGRPSGPAIRREKDGRQFVYIGWFGTKNGVRTRFRRLKVPLGGVVDFTTEPRIAVAGKDPKGGPACAQAKIS